MFSSDGPGQFPSYLKLGSQVGELQHYYVSPGSYLWMQGLLYYAFFLFVGIVEGGGR